MNIQANTIEELIDSSDHCELFQTLDHWMQDTFPELSRRLIASGTITFIGYGDLKNPADDIYTCLLSLAPQKNNISFYIGGEKNGQPILKSYEEHFAKSNVGKICLRLKNVKKLDFDILEAIVRDSIAWNEAN
ncbi:DUF1801 domain-containing protein [Enterococcus saccharolyticus]|uniref:YdhG-like domain-containing protein n=1 Tax=Enterococcus saccharolyticus subsp. saccharolyticus ATCC 43076 TaxID=1139996 RepID=S0JHC6_9ENTE|nr:DUF1801 domain-containing protein [Enterococcus saccharolyticus]EOT27945.1 hypothetical protein OMQ_01859 [Enterococcus saccharolyticus subsp. saccharolyticus ATCC 43076]EOT77323.1 hypothetical protein I572_02235 [Enterococcus saccharolyticus subsp. saccharolyticus ATCC 43076]OJG90901.1 hypothetical protein RV16_GL001149 [Enterococcus saccharolyticus]